MIHADAASKPMLLPMVSAPSKTESAIQPLKGAASASKRATVTRAG